jgi:hypothetical protein
VENSGRAGQATDDNKIWRMQPARWITKATQTQPEYAEYVAFAGQKWLLERT